MKNMEVYSITQDCAHRPILYLGDYLIKLILGFIYRSSSKALRNESFERVSKLTNENFLNLIENIEDIDLLYNSRLISFFKAQG